jgi:hypothetical protein
MELLMVNQHMTRFLKQIEDSRAMVSKVLALRNSLHGRIGGPEDLLSNLSAASMGSISNPGTSTNSLLPPQPQPIKLLAKLPKEIEEANLEKPELMRLAALYELIETEIDYIKDLTTMTTV